MKQNKLWKEIDRILWEEWDPIGVNNSKECRDEYSGYVASVINLLNENVDVIKLTKLLYQHTNINMGLSSKLEDHESVAKKLISIYNND